MRTPPLGADVKLLCTHPHPVTPCKAFKKTLWKWNYCANLKHSLIDGTIQENTKVLVLVLKILKSCIFLRFQSQIKSYGWTKFSDFLSSNQEDKLLMNEQYCTGQQCANLMIYLRRQYILFTIFTMKKTESLIVIQKWNLTNDLNTYNHHLIMYTCSFVILSLKLIYYRIQLIIINKLKKPVHFWWFIQQLYWMEAGGRTGNN